ncbi:DsbA family protein [Ancylomarina sp. 16SWW S1-10-2]|uniref:DsbA family oxidoreductase n=1 Tax=Ancylomarina sp. 16SWW S1-10-2 TaxID=2499681 RepID=UPI0012AD3ABF|nr:DsbA family protein [Ancylomarina sp. 16SWW S1-10-2]MRT92409.1 DsbA family protein [Ancylomarina sp. 16SWW S1-10-2]
MKYTITMISDFQCPYCYIGKGIIDGLKSEYDIEIIFKGYEIHPDIPEHGIPSEDYFPNAKEKNLQLQAFGRQHGLNFTDITSMPNSNKALQVAEYAKSVNKSEEYNTAMYEAFFFKDINISLIPEIKKLAKSVGISEEEVDAVFATDKYKNALKDNKKFCVDNNITSVPTFIINDKIGIVGAQSPENFRRAFKQLNEQ